MKKIAPIAAIALFAVAFTSCKKDWTCSCDDGQGGKTEMTIQNTTKALAKTACEGNNIGIQTGCELK